MSSNLLRSPNLQWIFMSNRRLQRFYANFLRVSRLQSHVKLILFAHSGRSNSLLAGLPEERSINSTRRTLSRKIAQRKISKIDRRATSIARAAKAHRRFLPGLAIACSLWDSLQRFRGAFPEKTSPDPTNQHTIQLPTSLNGAGHVATGRLLLRRNFRPSCSLATFKE